MVSALFFSQLGLIALVWLCCLLHGVWPSASAVCPTTPAEPLPPLAKRTRAPTPFTGLTHKPPCDACEQERAPRSHAPAAPPARLVMPRGRRHQLDTSHPGCPKPDCASRGGGGWGNRRAQGHPHGGPWRQLRGVVGRGSFLETRGTLLHGPRAAVDRSVRVIACLAAGLGIRGTARGFAVAPTPVLQGLVEAAEPLRAFARPGLHEVRGRQVPWDELFARLSAVKAGAVSAAAAIARLERSPQGGWVALAPESPLRLAIAVGHGTRAMAHRGGQQVVQRLAPDCAPLFLRDGGRAYLTAVLTH